jgi:hypothetical protein
MEHEMKIYNTLHQMEKYKNYSPYLSSTNLQQSHEFADYIHNTYNTLSDEEIKQLTLKCLSVNDCKHLLLLHELKYHQIQPKEHMTIDEFTKIALYYLNRYQCKAGGFFIEDTEWTVKQSQSEVLFENTVFYKYSNDYDTCLFLDLIINKLNSIAKNITVELREKNDSKIIYILLWATDNDQQIVSL